MDILEKQDPERKRLMAEAKKHKDNLSKEVKLMSEDAGKLLTNALVIGGTLALTYGLINGLSRSKSKKKKSKTVKFVAQPTEKTPEAFEDDGDSILSQIGNSVANEITTFLLNLAKEKLTEYLQSDKTTPDNEDN